jgi:hypothetical protein
MRGLLVTPWFAAGAGFVIAAALALNSPHTVLTYRPNTVPCRLCTEPTPQKGSEASATPGVQIRPVRPAKSAHARRGTGRPDSGPVAGLEVSFRVVWHKHGEFGAIITVPANRARHGWSLRFDMPGVRITQVWGAQWESAPGGHGGLARMLTRHPGRQPGSPRHSGRPGDSGPGRGHGQSGAQGQAGSQELFGSQGSPWDWTQPDVRFLVVAQGSPVTPVGCVLNGAGCHFG